MTTTRLATSDNPIGLVIDATNVYWADASDGTVSKAPIVSGATTVIARGVQPFVDAVDATNVYWTDLGAGTVNQTPIAGGATVVLAGPGAAISANVAPRQGPAGIAVDSTYVYWTEVGTGAINRVPIGGGTIVQYAAGVQPYGVEVDAANIYWANLASAPKISGFGGGTLPSGITGVGVVAKTLPVPPAVFAPAQLAAPSARFLAVDGTNVYWTSSDGGIYKVPKVGGSVVQLASGQLNPYGIFVDATNVYWCTNVANGSGGVSRTPLSGTGGGVVTQVASGLNSPAGVAVNATDIFFTSATPPTTLANVPPSSALGGVFLLTPIP